MKRILIATGEHAGETVADNLAFAAWREECEKLQQSGVYGEIADELIVTRGGIHESFCGGMACLDAEILKRDPTKLCLNSEINCATIDAGIHHAKGAGFQTNIFRARSGQEFFLDADSPTKGNIYKRRMHDLLGSVLYLEGDVETSEDTRKQALGDAMLDSSAMTFSGVSLKKVSRHNGSILSRHEMSFARSSNVLSALEQATIFTKPGGIFVRAEREVRHEGKEEVTEHTLGLQTDIYREMLRPYWTIAEPFRMLRSDLSGTRDEDEPAGMQRIATMLSMQRTDVPYDKADFARTKAAAQLALSFLQVEL